MKHLFLSFLCLILLANALPAQNNRPVADVFNENLAAILTDDAGKSQKAKEDWQRFCLQLGALGQEARKAEAVKLMTEALPQTKNVDALKWLLRQLAYIGDAGCVEAVGKCLDTEDQHVMDSAAWTLGMIPNNAAQTVLEGRLVTEKREAWKQAIQQTLTFRKARQEVTIPKLDDILKTLESGDMNKWDAALPEIGWLHNVAITDVPDGLDRFEKLTPTAKVLLIDILSQVRDRSALPPAVTLAQSADETLKLAGLRALGTLGDASVMSLLGREMMAGGDVAKTAKDSLRRLNFEKADELFLTAYKNAKNADMKYELLDVLRDRKGAIALQVFVNEIASPEERFRRKAIQALEQMGELSCVPRLVARLFVEENKELLDALDKAVVQINSRYDDTDGRGEALRNEFLKASAAEQAVLLPLIGKVGGGEAQEVMQTVLNDNSAPANLKNAAFQALCNWPDATVADELEKLAVGSDEARANQASRAFIRVVTLRADRPAKESLALFTKAMKLAKTDDDRRFLLTRVETARSIEVFNFVLPYLDDADLDQAACRAVVDMANDNGFYFRYRAVVDPALDKVIAKSKDKNHVERANRYKERR